MKHKHGGWTKWLAAAGILAAPFGIDRVQAQSSDALTDILIKKGILTQKEAEQIKEEAKKKAETNAPPTSLFKLNKAIKGMELFGDLRFRYEYREAQSIFSDTLARERFRYAVRVGVKGDLFDDFYYGLRLETGANPRSSWVTFGSEKGFPFPGPSAKSDDGINIGQVYVGWRPMDWAQVEVGKMPNPLYTTSMVWDGDINPEGASERFKTSVGNLDLFGTFGQFLYQDTDPDNPALGIAGVGPNKSDAFLLAWQAGGTYKFTKDLSFKVAPTLYTYTGHGQNAGFNAKFIGEGSPTGANLYDPATAGYINQTGINNLMVFETPGEFNFKLFGYDARVFGDFAMNLDGSDRAKAAGFAKYSNEDKAYQAGFGIGKLGLVYGQTAGKGAWEARTYWQHVEQYALDPNLLDSDFFEGRGNLEGVFVGFAYGITDGIIGTIRYGYADRINHALGTGGSNQDLPQINPVNRYQIFQLDLTWKF